ncbi:MAG: hypothetical protein K2X32_08825 [Phycisphaerales bacterium]|nr:hypothetical protein [Phycisphaerales bacterium]
MFGSILGNINVEDGVIIDLNVSGTIGTPTSPVTISAKNDGNIANSFITRIVCSAFYGTLRGPGSLPAPEIGEFRTTSGPVVGTLNFDGIYTAPQAGKGLFVATDLNANVSVTRDTAGPVQVGGKLVAGRTFTIRNFNDNASFAAIEPGATLRVNGSLPAGRTLSFGTATPFVAGISGQVILNAANTGGTWTGDVRIGGPTGSILSPTPAYDESSTIVGGGAVGLVPFRVKTQDFVPYPVAGTRRLSRYAFTGYVPNDPARQSAATISFYGPVRNVNASTLKLQSFNPSTSIWTDVPTANYQVPLLPVANTNGRDWKLGGNGTMTFASGTYRVLATTGIRCDIGLGANDPTIAAETAVEFFLSDQCANAGIANPCDIAYDNGQPLPPFGPAETGYVNNGVTEGDYNLFFAGFFVPELYCDVADDAGNVLPTTGVNNGVTEGDYNAFFAAFFNGCTN